MKTKRKVKSKKVSKNFSGETTLKQLPENTYFKTVGKISERLGHQSKKVTLDIYYHLNDVSNEKILDALI